MGFLSGLLGTKNNYQAKGVDIQQPVSFGQALQDTQKRNAGYTSLDGQNQWRNQQQNLSQALQNRVSGQAPSVAEQQMRAGQDRAIQQSAAMAASARGGQNPAMVQRQMMMNNAAQAQQTNQAAAQMRAQEQMAAENQLAGLTTQARQQDINTALDQQKTNDSFYQALLAAKNSQDANNINQNLGVSQINAGVAAQNAKNNGDIFTGLLNAGASIFAPVGKYSGGVVEGKAAVQGDSPVNDSEPHMLSPGEVVIPRSVALNPDFVKHLKKEPTGYGKVLAAQIEVRKRMGDK